jgi:phage I-like protein
MSKSIQLPKGIVFFNHAPGGEIAGDGQEQPVWKLPADGWIMLVPKGEVPIPSQGLLQVLDDHSISAMKESFDRDQSTSPTQPWPGLTLDYEHRSYHRSSDQPLTSMPTTTEAAGWVLNAEARPDGLWGKVEWSSGGFDAVKGGNFRLISPTFRPDDLDSLGNTELAGEKYLKVRPLRLDSVALTNKPRMRNQPPITNDDLDRSPTPGQNGATKRKIMSRLNTALLLNADASEESGVDAITELKTELAETKSKLAKMTDAHGKMCDTHKKTMADLLNARADSVEAMLVNHEDSFPDKETREDIRDLLLGNADATPEQNERSRARGTRWLKSLPKRSGGENLENREDGLDANGQPLAEPIHNAARANDPARRHVNGANGDGKKLSESPLFNAQVAGELKLIERDIKDAKQRTALFNENLDLAKSRVIARMQESNGVRQ